jgi:hypothetical protein
MPRKSSLVDDFDRICRESGVTDEAIADAQKNHRSSGCRSPGGIISLVERGRAVWLHCDGCGEETRVRTKYDKSGKP